MNIPGKPFNPYAQPEGPDCKPTDGLYMPGPNFGCNPMPPCPPTDCPPTRSPKPCPPAFPNVPPPGFGQVPPVPTVLEGQSLYEAMNAQTERVNQCIAQWNHISGHAFDYMKKAVAAARMNDVYYSDKEVHYQEGYDANDGCTYSLVEKKAVDCHNKPIYVRLVPAYDNTTNSGLKQNIFDVSFIKCANLIITAVPTDQTNWYGPAMYQGGAMPGETYEPPDENARIAPENYFVYGFNRNGVLRYFGNNVTQTVLEQNQMVDVLGGCIPIIDNGKIIDSAQELTTRGAITAIGFRSSDGSVFFFQCSAQDQPGMQGINVAKLFEGLNCTTAVITSFIDGDNKNESNAMMYMGQMCQVPQGGKAPGNLAYWVISKKPSFRNEFQHTIAELVQTTGRNAWETYLTNVVVQEFDERITQNHEDILAEIERATAAEQELKQDIDDEVARATQAEKWLQENINKEVDRAMLAEKYLQDNINAEVNRATTEEQRLDQKITDETNRATQAENQIASDLAAEKLRAQTRENEIQAALDKEIRERISADNDIINALEQEVLARRAADTALENKIDAVKKELEGDDQQLQDQINQIISGQISLPFLKLTGGTLTGAVSFTANNTLTLGRGPTAPLEAATKQYVDDAIASGTSPGGDVSKEYVDQQITNLQDQITDKVSKSGDTMAGDLNMDGNSIMEPVLESPTGIVIENGAGGPGKVTNLATPTQPTDATSKEYVDSAITTATENLSGTYVPVAGGSMTGDLNMDGASVINFNDPAARLLSRKALAKAVSQGAVNKGSVYNDSEDIVVKSVNGRVSLLGSSLYLSDGAGNKIPITGVSQIANDGTALISFDPTETVMAGPVSIENAAGGGAKLSAGLVDAEAVDIGISEMRDHVNSTGVHHLDVNVGSSEGAVYINRTNNGSVVEGGTGELHVTEIEAPQELRLNPSSSVNVMNKTVKNVGLLALKTPTTTSYANMQVVDEGTNNYLEISPGGKKVNFVNSILTGLKAGTASNDAATVGQLPKVLENNFKTIYAINSGTFKYWEKIIVGDPSHQLAYPIVEFTTSAEYISVQLTSYQNNTGSTTGKVIIYGAWDGATSGLSTTKTEIIAGAVMSFKSNQISFGNMNATIKRKEGNTYQIQFNDTIGKYGIQTYKIEIFSIE